MTKDAMLVRALIFDFDGLIVDTETADFESWREVYATHGATLALDDWVSCIGKAPGAFDPYAQLEAVLGRAVDRGAIRAQRRVRYAELAAGLPLLPGVADYVREAKRLELTLAIASNAPIREVVAHLSRLHLDRYFDCISCADDAHPGKPDPAVYVAALVSLGVDPERAIALEDSPSGVAAASAAGVFCVAVPSALTASLDFRAADYRVSSLADVALAELLTHIERAG